MAVLGDIDFRKVIENDEGIIISNLREKSITAAGYDLTIGFICDADDGTLPELVSSETNEPVRRYCLLPEHRYLIISREYVSFPAQYMATLHSRASYALKGIMLTSTTIDPNFEGFLYATLINCSHSEVYIKEHNQFATMVVHQILTPTDTDLQTNENGTPRDGQETLNAPFSNIDKNAVTLSKVYVTDELQKIKADHRAAQLRAAKKMQEKHDMAAHVQVLSEKEAQSEQCLRNLQEQMDSLQAELVKSKQTAEKEKKKRWWHTLILRVFITILLFLLLYSYWGIAVKTFLVSVIVPNFLNIPSFIVDSKGIGDMIKKRRQK